MPELFEVKQEIIKLSEAFKFSFDPATKNFTAISSGDVIARDGDVTYQVGPIEELVVFPNPDVKVVLRAGLMVVRKSVIS